MMKKPALIVALLILCSSIASANDSLWSRIDILQKVMQEQSRMARESRELKYQLVYMDRLVETSMEREKLIKQYVKKGVK